MQPHRQFGVDQIAWYRALGKGLQLLAGICLRVSESFLSTNQVAQKPEAAAGADGDDAGAGWLASMPIVFSHRLID